LDSVTLEDWGEEIFAEGVELKWRKWARGRGRKKLFSLPQPQPLPCLCTNPLRVKHPVTIQNGGIKVIYLAFHILLQNSTCTAG